ncbi:TolC family protein [Pelomonas sp. P7]|uniref:TolC family protein n=1 Tax=Pelomonas caseinilytica TaxID=2906763 RepID=A0ABS8X9N1_9BURK|nr:TolC family protein [Pelomonas sp. P7]MCE4537581.1 TolC family protein [Pelomonas sp. P7]
MSPSALRVAALAAALLTAPWAVSAPLSLDEALDLAVQRSQLARSARAGAAGAAEMASAAGQLPDPVLNLGVDNLPATGASRFNAAAEDMTMKRIGIAQEWVPADKRAAREAVAAAAARRESLLEGVAAADARLQAALAYVDAFYAGQAEALAALNEGHAREEREAGRARVAAAAAGSAEALALDGALGMAEDDAAELRQQHAAAAAALQRWTGLLPDALGLPALPTPADADAFVARHPAVVARAGEVEVARQEAQATRLNRRPNWSYELSYGQRSGRPDLLSFGISIPLPIAPAARQDRESAARLALLDKAEAELAEARRGAAGEYAALSSDAARLGERIERYEARVLEPLRQRTVAALAAYRSNQAGLTALFEARHAELQARRRLLELRRDLARAVAQLAFKPLSRGDAS